VSERAASPWTTLGISRSWYFAIRSGERRPSTRVALALYDLTGEQTGVLVGLDEDAIAAIRRGLGS